jgi:1,2-diacylglycerol 3-alpha-glucosyltransferase
MKIGIFTNNYRPITGGLTTSIVGFKKGLEAKGHDVFIFAPRFPNYSDSQKNTYRYPSINLRYKTTYPLAIPFSRRNSKIIKNLDLDIIHSQHPQLMGWAAQHWAGKLKLPLVFTNHTRYESYTHYIPLIPQSLLKWLAVKSSTNYANSCNAVIAPTKEIKDILLKNGVVSPIEVIPSGIDIAKFSNLDKKRVRAEIRKSYGIGEKEILLLCIDRVAPEKNLEFLLRVFQKVSSKNKQIRFMLVGDGPSLPGIKKLAEKLGIIDKMTFPGLIALERIAQYYASGDIFIHSSLTETQGLITVEAMASALPVVAIKATGVCDLITNNQNGILTENSEEEFSRAVLKLIADENYRIRLGKNAFEEAEKYSIENSTEKLIKVYQELLK